MEVAVALLLHLEIQLFFEKAAALAQFDDVVVEAVETLGELCGMQPQRRAEMIGVLLLEAVKQHAKAAELPVQAQAGPPLPAEGGALTIWDPDRTFSSANLRLAGLLQNTVIAQLHAAGWAVPDRGTLRDTQNTGGALTAAGARYGHEALIGPYARGWVSHPSGMPGAIIEPLFLTRPTEADIAASAEGEAVLARAITTAVEQFLGA